MAKVKLPLEVANGVMARTIEELRDNFDIKKVVGHFLDGKLNNWLEARYYEEELEKINELSESDPELVKKLCKIFDVEYADEKVDVDVIQLENERLLKLKQYTDDEEIIANIDSVTFNQEELADLYDRGVKKIYLCEGEFKVPKSKQELEYVEIGNPKVVYPVDYAKYDLKKILAYLELNYDLLTKTIYEQDGKVWFFEHKMRKQSDGDFRDSSILYRLEPKTNSVEQFKHFHESDFQSQRIRNWLIYKESIFYISSCQRGLNFYLKVYNCETDKIREIDHWDGDYHTAKVFMEIFDEKLRYGSTIGGKNALSPWNKEEKIQYEKNIDLY